ncbi:hypothetical protein [Leminorella grimontii]
MTEYHFNEVCRLAAIVNEACLYV